MGSPAGLDLSCCWKVSVEPAPISVYVLQDSSSIKWSKAEWHHNSPLKFINHATQAAKYSQYLLFPPFASHCGLVNSFYSIVSSPLQHVYSCFPFLLGDDRLSSPQSYTHMQLLNPSSLSSSSGGTPWSSCSLQHPQLLVT